MEERLNYLSILTIENDITGSLFYEEALKEHAVQKVGKRSVRQLTNKKSRFFP
jgi:hypothetical protein